MVPGPINPGVGRKEGRKTPTRPGGDTLYTRETMMRERMTQSAGEIPGIPGEGPRRVMNAHKESLDMVDGYTLLTKV